VGLQGEWAAEPHAQFALVLLDEALADVLLDITAASGQGDQGATCRDRRCTVAASAANGGCGSVLRVPPAAFVLVAQ